MIDEHQFIEICLRYLDGAAGHEEVELLGDAMLDRAERRATYRDLVRQSQLAHEWQSTALPAPTPVARPRLGLKVALVAGAAAAAILIASIFLPQSSPPSADPRTVSVESNPAAFFSERAPSWSDIYRSPFDYPESVWRAEFDPEGGNPERIDHFSDSDLLPLLAATPAAQFSKRLAAIDLMPADTSGLGNGGF